MKIYVDEMPKSCWECPCFKNDLEFPCGLSDGTKDYYLDEIDGGDCPLQKLPTKELFSKLISELKAENERLQQQLKDSENIRKELEEQEKFNFDYRDMCRLEEYQRWADKEITKLDKENQRLHTELSLKVDYIHELVEVKEQLKQQLHDLPKKIVREIRTDFLYGIDGETTGIDIILDTILKKYGGKNET